MRKIRNKSLSMFLSAMLLSTAALQAEPSVYGGYGGGNAQALKNKNMIYALRQKVARMQEEIEGLRSVIDSLSQQVNRLSRQSGNERGDNRSAERIRALEERITLLEKKTRSSQKASRPSGSGNPAAKRASATNTASKADAGGKKASVGGGDPLQKAASSKLFSRGVRLVQQKRYTEAKRRFDILLGRKYKPASTHFYLGEIAYRAGHYDDAIKEYQQSAEIDENAAYMDRLLLHTGIALEKSGEKEQARNFFQAIVDGYPGTYSAREAKKHLK